MSTLESNKSRITMTLSKLVKMFTSLMVFALVSTNMVLGADNQITSTSMTVSLTKSKTNGIGLHITLKNTRQHSIKIYASNLPWESSSGLTLILVEAHAGDITLPKIVPTVSPIVGEYNIAPDQIMQGDLLLDARFPTLRAVLERTDVIVFWNFELKPTGDSPFSRAGGWLLIPKTGMKVKGSVLEK